MSTFRILALTLKALVREREHVAMARRNTDGTTTPLILPNHPRIKSSTLGTTCNQAGIDREEFLRACQRS